MLALHDPTLVICIVLFVVLVILSVVSEILKGREHDKEMKRLEQWQKRLNEPDGRGDGNGGYYKPKSTDFKDD